MGQQMGDAERRARRLRFVFDCKANKSMSLDEIVDAWNTECKLKGWAGEERARATIARDIQEGLKQLTEETKVDANLYRNMLTARIEYALSRKAFTQKIEEGDLFAVDRLLRGAKQLAELHGANMPTKVAQTDSEGNDMHAMTEDERARRISELFAQAQARAEEQGEDEDEESET